MHFLDPYSIPPASITYSKLEIMKNILSLQKFLPETSSLIYSLKANNYHELISYIAYFTQGFDICSQEEADILIKKNIEGKDIFITGYDKVNIQQETLIKLSSLRNNLFFVLESPRELDYFKLLIQRGVNGKGLFRLSYLPGTTYGIYNGLPKGHFGFTRQQIIDCLTKGGHFNYKYIVGFHCYIGSQIQSVEAIMISLVSAITEIKAICQQTDFYASVINFGGGFPHAFGAQYQPLSYPALPLKQALHSELSKLLHLPESIYFESGRAIVGTSGHLQVSVLDYHLRPEAPYFVVNAGISQIGALHLLRSLRPSPMLFYAGKSQPEGGRHLQKFDVYGPACTSLDHLGTALVDPVQLSNLKTLYCDNMGAYTASAALNGFHAKPRIAERLI